VPHRAPFLRRGAFPHAVPVRMHLSHAVSPHPAAQSLVAKKPNLTEDQKCTSFPFSGFVIRELVPELTTAQSPYLPYCGKRSLAIEWLAELIAPY
jgi:hypothetical protein